MSCICNDNPDASANGAPGDGSSAGARITQQCIISTMDGVGSLTREK